MIAEPLSNRRIGIALRGDLQVVHQRRQGADHAVIKDPHSLRFFEMSWQDFNLATCIQEGMTAAEIVADWRHQMPAICAGQNDETLERRAERICHAVRQLGLCENSQPYQPAAPRVLGWTAWLRQFARRVSAPMFVRLPLFDPDELLGRLVARWRPLFSRGALCTAAAFVLLSFVASLGHLGAMQLRPEWFGVWQNVLALYAGILVLKVIHESGHALACKALGGHVHEVGAQLLVFHPTFFVDISDTWMWPSRRRRIVVAAAGFGAELVAAAVLFWLWVLLTPGFARDLCLNLLFIASVSAVLFNANPLMRYDGYHMLADALGEPHLRRKAFGELSESVRRFIFGARLIPRSREPRRGVLLLYATASSAYLLWIAFIVAGFLRSILAPYGLEWLGHGLLAAWLFSMLAPVLGFLGGVLRDAAGLPGTERRRPLFIGLTGTVLVGFFAFTPLPVRVERESVIEVPATGVVRAPQPGLVAELFVTEGQRVRKGERLARLENRGLAAERAKLALEVELTSAVLLSASGGQTSAPVQQGLRKLNEARANAAQAAHRLSELDVLSPCDGVVVTRLLERRRGQFLRQGDELLSIAPDGVREVLLPLNEKEARRIGEGATVRFRTKALPARTFEGVVTVAPLRLGDAPLPPALTALAGGDLVLDAAGHLLAGEVTHLARCRIAPADPQLRPGLTGRARIDCGSLRAGQWFFEALIDAIHLEHRL